MIKIDKNVPIPIIPPTGRPALYPFAELDIGDSFLAPNMTPGTARQMRSRYGQKLGRTFIQKREPTGIRIWRIA